jgi:hypothetical protein
MAWQLDEVAPLPRPVLARRLAAQIGRSFSEVIVVLGRLGGDADAAVRHFHDEEAAAERRTARCRRRDDPPAPEPPPSSHKPELIFICKSESEPTVARPPCPPPPDNAVVIDEMMSRGVLARAVLVTGRTVYASPGFARYLSAGEEYER